MRKPTVQCPACSEPAVPIVYGLPDPSLSDSAERGEVLLSGCVIAGDDPTAACNRCGAVMWDDGLHAIEGDLRCLLVDAPERLEVAATTGGGLWVSDGQALFTVGAGDIDLVVLGCFIDLLLVGEGVNAWLARREVPAAGEAAGLVTRVAIDGTSLLVETGDGTVTIPDWWPRVALYALHDVGRSLGVRSVVDVADWLAEYGVQGGLSAG